MSLDQWIDLVIRCNPTKKFWWDRTTEHYCMEIKIEDVPFIPKYFNGNEVRRSWGKVSEAFYMDSKGKRQTLLKIFVQI